MSIARGILLSEHQGPDNATHASETDERRTAECTFPVSSNVVSLIGHARGDVGVGSGADEEDAEVADADVVGPADERETGDCDDGVDDDYGTAGLVLVAKITGGVPALSSV
jgi:hypothetical protein